MPYEKRYKSLIVYSEKQLIQEQEELFADLKGKRILTGDRVYSFEGFIKLMVSLRKFAITPTPGDIKINGKTVWTAKKKIEKKEIVKFWSVKMYSWITQIKTLNFFHLKSGEASLHLIKLSLFNKKDRYRIVFKLPEAFKEPKCVN